MPCEVDVAQQAALLPLRDDEPALDVDRFLDRLGAFAVPGEGRPVRRLREQALAPLRAALASRERWSRHLEEPCTFAWLAARACADDQVGHHFSHNVAFLTQHMLHSTRAGARTQKSSNEKSMEAFEKMLTLTSFAFSTIRVKYARPDDARAGRGALHHRCLGECCAAAGGGRWIVPSTLSIWEEDGRCCRGDAEVGGLRSFAFLFRLGAGAPRHGAAELERRIAASPIAEPAVVQVAGDHILVKFHAARSVLEGREALDDASLLEDRLLALPMSGAAYDANAVCTEMESERKVAAHTASEARDRKISTAVCEAPKYADAGPS